MFITSNQRKDVNNAISLVLNAMHFFDLVSQIHQNVKEILYILVQVFVTGALMILVLADIMFCN